MIHVSDTFNSLDIKSVNEVMKISTVRKVMSREIYSVKNKEKYVYGLAITDLFSLNNGENWS